MPFFTYILSCADGTYYIGKTSNITKRLRQHNGEITGGAKYTAARRPVTLAYFEEFPTHKESAQREYILKQLTRKGKEELVEHALVVSS